MFDDAGREIRAWDFDTAADFGAAGVEAIDMTIDPLGSITPHGYVYGALVARGVEGMKLWTNADADWAKTTTVSPTSVGLWTGNDLAVPGDLRFVGVATTSMVSVWMEGELWINAPGETFRTLGNDTAFLYIAADGKTFQKLTHNSAAVATVATSGWYPVRLGWADGDNSGDLQFEVNPGGGFAALDRTRLRATTSQLRGTARNVYYREIHGGGIAGNPPVMTIQDTALHATTTFVPPLPGSVTTTPTPFDWSARWTGQFYAAAAGSYSFRVDSDDGNRILLGTSSQASGFVRNAKGAVTTNVTADLVAGWNDLVIDYNHVDGTPTFAVSIVAAPAADAALVGNAIPRDRLRPIEPRADRLITRSNIPGTPPVILDNQANTYAELATRIDAHPDELVASIAVTARVVSDSPNQLQFRLVAPNNSVQSRSMIVVPDGNQVGSYIAQGVYELQVGQAAIGTWRFGISDNSGSGSTGNSSYRELHVTMHTTTGREQIATTSTWRSPIIENKTDVVLIDFVNWSERTPAGSTVDVRMRTCAMADCSDGVWSDQLANGAAPMLTPNRYIQLQVTMTSDGTREPEVDKINIQYRTAPPT